MSIVLLVFMIGKDAKGGGQFCRKLRRGLDCLSRQPSPQTGSQFSQPLCAYWASLGLGFIIQQR